MNNDNNMNRPIMPENTQFVAGNGNAHAPTPTVPYSANGRWEAVDASMLNFPISGPSNQPIMGPDGNIYCVGNTPAAYGSIYANQNNAIPQPASIVQLPPIIQPIALVPFASQNQPMLQYDPNQRPEEPAAPVAPRYKKKPYRGISVVQIISSLVIIALLCVLYIVNALGEGLATGLDSIFGLAKVFEIELGDSTYYDMLLSFSFGAGFSEAFSSDVLTSIYLLAIPVFSAVIIILSVVSAIVYLVKAAKGKSPRGFNGLALTVLILAILIIVCIFLLKPTFDLFDLAPSIALYAVAGIALFQIILNYFAKKHAHVLDEAAFKRVYIINE